MQKKPELLAPCGKRDCLIAAINGGADAVYFGLDSFNARMRAENFTKETCGEAISLCNAYGVKSYITLNTRLFDDELTDALKLAELVYEKGASALIIADMGLATQIKKQLPDFEIHASTQLTGHSVADAEALRDAGFSRMVINREVTAENLRYLTEHSPIETEMFIHGAYCVSLSGQCLMSAVMGGRSGNRGSCAQPCRQCYTLGKEKGYPLSLKDMCLAGHITELCDMGVHSLKIEGRQKPPYYVEGVTAIYRRLLDEERNATDEEISALYDLFNREGFSDGYFKGDHGNMLGVRLREDYDPQKTADTKPKKKVPVSATLVANGGEEVTLTLKTKTGVATAKTEPLCENISPLTEEGARKNISRLGSTPFELADFEFVSDGACSVSLSMINALRREACEKLLSCERKHVEIKPVSTEAARKEETFFATAEFSDKSQVTPLAKDFFKKMYTLSPEKGTGTVLPPYCPDKTGKADGEYFLVHSASQLKEHRDGDCLLSLRGNVFNSAAAEYYVSLGAKGIIAAPEVRLAKLRDFHVSVPLGTVIYGRLPLMLTVRCAISDGKFNCKNKNGEICKSELIDRYRVSFPVFGMPDCTNIIYNSVPIYMADKMQDVEKSGVDFGHFIFTTETPEEVDEIINAYINRLPAKTNEIKRLTF